MRKTLFLCVATTMLLTNCRYQIIHPQLSRFSVCPMTKTVVFWALILRVRYLPGIDVYWISTKKKNIRKVYSFVKILVYSFNFRRKLQQSIYLLASEEQLYCQFYLLQNDCINCLIKHFFVFLKFLFTFNLWHYRLRYIFFW